METTTKTPKIVPIKKKDYLLLSAKDITIEDGFNVRVDYGDIDELARNIEENGVKVPTRGFKSDTNGETKYVLTDGHRRIEACKLLNSKGIDLLIPFIVDKTEQSVEQRVIDILACNDGKRLTPLEEAEAIHRLLNYGLSEKDIVKRTGKTGVYISNLKLLQAAPQKVKLLITNDVVSATLAMKVLRETENFLEAVEILEHAVDYATLTKQETIDDTEEFEPVKVTQKDVDKSQNKTNSFSELKKVIKKGKDRVLRQESQEFYEFATQLINGELSRQDLEDLFFIAE